MISEYLSAVFRPESEGLTTKTKQKKKKYTGHKIKQRNKKKQHHKHRKYDLNGNKDHIRHFRLKDSILISVYRAVWC